MRNVRHPRGVILYAVLGGLMIQVGVDYLLRDDVLGGVISVILAGLMILTAVHRMREDLGQGPVELESGDE